MADRDSAGGHAFISYVREDAAHATELQDLLQDAGVRVWRDTVDLLPGENWSMAIRRAIREESLVFLACFSRESVSRATTYQNEELVLAIEQLRRRQPDEPWLIPVRFDDCEIPDRDIGAGRTLASIQRADLFGEGRDQESERLVASVHRILGRSETKAAHGRERAAQLPELKAEDIGSLNPREAARRLAQTPLDSAVRRLARAPVIASAEVLDALLAENEQLTVQVLAHAHRRRARELIAEMRSPGWLVDLPAAADAIDERERELRGSLGEGTGPLAHTGPSRAGTHGFGRDFENGQVHWSAQGGAQATTGTIGERYRELAGPADGPLGFPLTSEADAEPGAESGTTGRFQRFEPDAADRRVHSTIYWSEKHGAHPVWGGISELYEANGGTGAWLGFPRSAEISAGPSKRDDGNGTTGVYQKFEGGSIHYSQKTGAIAVPAPIDGHLRSQHRGVAGSLGFPVSPMLVAAPSPYGAEGHFQRFEGKWDYPGDILSCWSDDEGPGGATIYTSKKHGTHCVGFGNGILYERLGGTSSWLGFPLSDEVTVPGSADSPRHSVQRFEGGVIVYSEKQDSVAVPKATIDYLDQQPGLRDDLGLPLKRPGKSAPDEQLQFFENGVVTHHDGTTEAWLRPSAAGQGDQEDIELSS